MSFDGNPTRDTEAGTKTHTVRLLGTGADDPTVELGKGITCERDGVGIYTLTWRDNPGVWVGPAGESFQATTSANVKGCSVSWGVYDEDTYSVQLKVWDVAGAARELALLEWLTAGIKFKVSDV